MNNPTLLHPKTGERLYTVDEFNIITDEYVEQQALLLQKNIAHKKQAASKSIYA